MDAKDAEEVLVTKDDFEHALTYDVKPVSDYKEPHCISQCFLMW